MTIKLNGFCGVGAMLVTLLVCGTARAEPETYNLSDIVAPFSFAEVNYSITGSFTFDATDNAESALDINFAPEDSLIYGVNGPYLSGPPSSGSPTKIYAYAGLNVLELDFAAPLGSGPDALTHVELTTGFEPPAGGPIAGCSQNIDEDGYAQYGCGSYFITSGTADPESPSSLPEPSSFALLGLALPLFAQRRRSHWLPKS